MQLLLIAPMLLLNALATSAIEGQKRSLGLEKRFLGRLMKAFKPLRANAPGSLANDAQQALSEGQRSVSLGPLEHEFKVNGHPLRLPAEIQLQVFEHLSMTFEEAKEIASEKGASIDWAYQYHDPSKDNYSIVKEWLKMDNSDNAKDKLREKMMLNPTLRMLFSIEHTRENLMNAIEEGNLGIVMYLIATGFKLMQRDLYITIRQGNIDMMRVLINSGKIKANGLHLDHAIRLDKLEVVKFLIREAKVKPLCDVLHIAITLDKIEILKYLIEVEKIKPDGVDLGTAIYYQKVDIVTYLIREANLKPTVTHLYQAIYRGNLVILKVLIKEGKLKPNKRHLSDAINFGYHDTNRDIFIFLINEQKIKPDRDHLTDAIRNEALDIVKYFLKDRKIKPINGHLSFAIRKGDSNIVKTLIRKGRIKPNYFHLTCAILRGDLEIIKIVIEEGNLRPTQDHLKNAIKYYQPDSIIQYLTEKRG